MNKLNKKNYIVGVLFSIFIFGSCKKPVGPQCENCNDVAAISYKDVLIGCEGNFGWGNASFSIYNPENKTVSNQVFQSVNGIPLGDVVQSATEIDGKLYLVVNNSGKIHVVDTSNYQLITTLSGFTSPRYIVKGVGSTAYVSDLYSNQITLVDLSTHSITGSISLTNWSEEMLHTNNTLWITCPDTNYIIRVNTVTNTSIDTLIVAKGVSSIVEDKNGKIWALASGGINETLPVLARFDGITGQLEQSFTFTTIQQSPSSLRMDKEKEHLFFLNNGCFKMSILATQLPSNAIIEQNSALFYGLGIHPITNEIFISDAVDYVSSGRVFRYDVNYQKTDEFSVGIIPSFFWFK